MKDNIEFKIISINDVPRIRRRSYDEWDKIFESIPNNMAMVLERDKINQTFNSIRSILKRRHKEGKFKNLRATQINKILYIINEAIK